MVAKHDPTDPPVDEQVKALIDRILSADDAKPTHTSAVRDYTPHGAQALDEGGSNHTAYDGDQFDLEQRHALRRVKGLSTELDDVTEVEYRQLRLEQVVLAGLWTEGTLTEAEHSLQELTALADTAGSTVLDAIIQRRDAPDPATFLGSGKARQLAEIVRDQGADTVIVDTELAQLEYLLPRLRGWGESMSRQAGGQAAGGAGIGSRGPGETKIELDRRRIRDRMAKLRRDIKQMESARRTKRARRRRNQIPSVAIAGYTNAGKSSLLNRLTKAGVLVENALFATLDPTVRATETADGVAYTLSDTVGFVRQLPTQLVEAFRSTLEEVDEADLILHVVDASHPEPEAQIQAVHQVFQDTNIADIQELIVFNKADAADTLVLARLRRRYPNSIVVSAATGEGFEELQQAIADGLPRPSVHMDLLVPYTDGDIVHRLHSDDTEILAETYEPEGTAMTVLVYPEDKDHYLSYVR